MPHREPFALFDDATWPERPALLLSDPVRLIETWSPAEVQEALAAVEAGAKQGLIAAGALTYELGYVFEPRLSPLAPRCGRPLLRFHLFGEQRRLSAADRTRWLTERVQGEPSIGEILPSLNAEQHNARVNTVRQLIGAGDVYQVNLTFKLRTAAGDPFALYAELREKARAGGSAFIRFADEDILSFSPELFFRVKESRIFARPMKGTRMRAPDAQGDALQRLALRRDEKERAENLMIVDLLRNDLAQVSKTGSVEVTDLFSVETYPRLHTMTSGIVGELADGASFSDIVRALFPCGSVTGAPKIRAMEIIRAVEDEPRGIYCGAIGYVGRNTMAFTVGIRTLLLRDGVAEMGVGGGIVWDSNAASEYAECMLKARFLTDAHERFRLIETMRWTKEDGFHLLARHLKRLEASSRYFGFRFNERAVLRALTAATQDCEGVQRVRLTLGMRGDLQVEAEPIALPVADAIWRFAIAEARRDSRDPRTRHKTSLRALLERELATQRAASDCDEVVFLNERNEVTEGSRTSVFVECEQELLTPPLSSGVLDGCLRRELIENGPRRVVETTLYPSDLERGTVWLGNSLRGLVRARAVESTRDIEPTLAIQAASLEVAPRSVIG